MSTSKRFGPGTWYTLHVFALSAEKSEKKKDAFISFVEDLSQNMWCSVCEEHFSRYVAEHPLEPYRNKKHGLFEWTWRLHNTVNQRLGKPQLSFSEALQIYTEKSSKPCNASKKNDKIYVLPSWR
jgi:hypothetical protein